MKNAGSWTHETTRTCSFTNVGMTQRNIAVQPSKIHLKLYKLFFFHINRQYLSVQLIFPRLSCMIERQLNDKNKKNKIDDIFVCAFVIYSTSLSSSSSSSSFCWTMRIRQENTHKTDKIKDNAQLSFLSFRFSTTRRRLTHSLTLARFAYSFIKHASETKIVPFLCIFIMGICHKKTRFFIIILFTWCKR